MGNHEDYNEAQLYSKKAGKRLFLRIAFEAARNGEKLVEGAFDFPDPAVVGNSELREVLRFGQAEAASSASGASAGVNTSVSTLLAAAASTQAFPSAPAGPPPKASSK